MRFVSAFRNWFRRFPVLYYLAGAPRAVWVTVRAGSVKTVLFAPPGHFYSPLPDLRSYSAPPIPDTLPGLRLSADRQVELAADLSAHQYVPDRYPADSRYFSQGDAAVLFGMIREYAPQRIVEVGSGHSTAVMLDAGVAAIVCIEPNAGRMRRSLRPDDQPILIEAPLQSVPSEVFADLESGDILFVDSTHVAKAGSDVLRIVFDILPSLEAGVLVHFHDVLWPFEYPADWIMAGRAWNEAYLLRAFLHNNHEFEILLWPSWLEHFGQWARPSSGSLWLRKVGSDEAT